ncbi:hypothetical protein Zmor_001528 [Zophobas morio]|uniref:Retrotransposon gag domain-containing protein n=1 Tax=Zophobas morio TaxID=2755281 RepID=A0AA38IZ79_9CUCU|nr:hypothetical protein Zmor_001528 [Zophobas morio]
MDNDSVMVEYLERDEIIYELQLRGAIASDLDSTDELCEFLRERMIVERQGVELEECGQRECGRELQTCSFKEHRLRQLLREARLTNDLINRVEALLWHLSGRVHRISALTEGQQGDRAELQLRLRESKRWYRERLRLGAVQGVQRPESSDSGERARAVGENPDAIPISKWGVTFSGKETEPVAVLKFLKRVEEGRSMNGIDEERMRRGFAQLLEPPALTWYRQCVRDSVSSWRELKERLKQEFLPDDYEEGVLETLRECKQGSSERVSFFVARFEEISE